MEERKNFFSTLYFCILLLIHIPGVLPAFLGPFFRFVEDTNVWKERALRGKAIDFRGETSGIVWKLVKVTIWLASFNYTISVHESQTALIG